MNPGYKTRQLSACVVLATKDNLGSIITTLKDSASTPHSGGGTSLDFLPRND